MLVKDRAVLTSRKRTAEGYLLATARLSRSGIQDYFRGELGLDGDPSGIVKIYRPPAEVFDEESMNSFALKPVTDDHPSEDVTIGNFRELAVGFSGETISRDGNFVRGTVLITDLSAIQKIEMGKAELSPGYFVEVDMTPGTTPEGEAYDGAQKKIRGNHIALVDAGRCGGHCRLDDRKSDAACNCASCKEERQTKESAMTDKPKTKLVDGVPVTTLDEAFEVIERKDKLIADSKNSLIELRDKLLSQQKDHAEAVSRLEGELTKLRADLTDAKLDERAEQRLDLIMKAADYLPESYETKAKTNAQIAKDALVSVLGDVAVTGRKDEEFLAMFAMLDMKPKNGASLADALLPANRGFSADNGRADYAKLLSDRYRGAEASAAKH